METETIREKHSMTGKIEDLAGNIRNYIETFYKLTVLRATQKATNIVSAVFAALVVCTLGLFMTFFAGFGLALWVGNRIESRVGGFLIVAGIFFLAVLLLVALRQKIVFPYIRKLFIRKFHE
jgi:hypothetical protein